MLNLSILIPVRNETLNLRVMLKILNAILDEKNEVLVIYDSLEDESVPVIKELQEEFKNLIGVYNHGGGIPNALKNGILHARSDRLLIFAADEVGPVLAIDDMMYLMDQGCQFVSCTRYAHGGRRLGGSWIGHFLSYTANRLLRMFSAIAFSDSTTGIKMFRKKDFASLVKDSSSAGWSAAFEMAVNAQLLGLKLGEVPIISIDRLFGGKSTFKLFSWVKAYLKHFMMAIQTLPRWKKTSQTFSIVVKVPTNLMRE